MFIKLFNKLLVCLYLSFGLSILPAWTQAQTHPTNPYNWVGVAHNRALEAQRHQFYSSVQGQDSLMAFRDMLAWWQTQPEATRLNASAIQLMYGYWSKVPWHSENRPSVYENLPLDAELLNRLKQVYLTIENEEVPAWQLSHQLASLENDLSLLDNRQLAYLGPTLAIAKHSLAFWQQEFALADSGGKARTDSINQVRAQKLNAAKQEYDSLKRSWQTELNLIKKDKTSDEYEREKRRVRLEDQLDSLGKARRYTLTSINAEYDSLAYGRKLPLRKLVLADTYGFLKGLAVGAVLGVGMDLIMNSPYLYVGGLGIAVLWPALDSLLYLRKWRRLMQYEPEDQRKREKGKVHYYY